MGLVKEFREFAVKGNALDMAVGIIVGAAFGKIVTSLVNDMLMPLIGLMLGAGDVSKLQIVLKTPVIDSTGAIIQPGSVLRYGMFINTVIDFLLIAISVFVIIKLINLARNWTDLMVKSGACSEPQKIEKTEKPR